ncbi:hypothetical protein ACFUTX_12135 [Microbacterium sp. NPDC057407]|uniref:hypothetical protein n=1 Tax=Microbacterium sp. NPDC057407 TaxID=3346120 RepID=UPI00366F9C6A
MTLAPEYDWVTVKGRITSEFTEDQDGVRLDLVARDAEGKIRAVASTTANRVPAGGTAAWNLSYWHIPLDAKVEVYPHL